MGLQRIERILNSRCFRDVFRRGRCFRDPLLRIHYLDSERGVSRMGLVVSRKVGDAVRRNRVKRWLRQIFRERKGDLPRTLDVVLLACPGQGDSSLAAYRLAFDRFLAWVRSRPAGPRREAP